MTDMLCLNCDYEIFNDKNEFNYYLASFHKRYDRGLYYNNKIININLNVLIKYLIIMFLSIMRNLICILSVV